MIDDVLIIAEAGVNHNGDIGLAKELIAAAAEAGADIVKFQTFKAEKLVTKTAEKAQYQKDNCGADETQFEMLKKLELNEDKHFELIECCKNNNIQFLSTAFDNSSLDFLARVAKLDLLKIPSGEITNGPFIHDHAKTGAHIILSTGMATLGEIEKALAVLSHGYCKPKEHINSLDDCFSLLATEDGQKSLRNKVTLLHCTTSYPAPVESVNLRAMGVMQDAFGLPVGYSDHTSGLVASIAAVARGASVIEKHFTLDKNMEGPDHKASLEPNELKKMVEDIRLTSQMLGNGVKLPHPVEISAKLVARKSIVARQKIKAGDILTSDNLTIIRPGAGRSPMEWWAILGTLAIKNYEEGDLIE